MGRKSKAKKKERETVAQKAKVKKTEKKTTKKIKELLPKFKQINHQKVLGGLLTLIMLTILITVGFLLFDKGLRAKPIASFLPANKTVLTLEINIDPNYNQFLKTRELVNNDQILSDQHLKEYILNTFKLDYNSTLKPWFGRSIGLAYINPNEQNARINLLYFAEIGNGDNFRQFIKQYKQDSESNYEIYQLPRNFYGAEFSGYFFISPTKNGLAEFLTFNDKGGAKLSGATAYTRIADNMPMHRAAYLFLDFKQISNSFLQGISFLSESGLNAEVLKPISDSLVSEGLALVALDDHFVIQSFLNYSSQNVDTEKSGDREKYRAKLTTLASEDALAFWGAQDLDHLLNRLLRVIANGDDSSLVLFQDILQNYVANYLGENTNLFRDILPLFNKEFAIVIEDDSGKESFKLLLELENPDTDKEKINTIMNDFSRLGGLFRPKIVEHTLPDGTLAREIVAEPDAITRSNSEYKKYRIYEMKIDGHDWGFYYTFIDNVLVAANYLDELQKTIDLNEDKSKSLRQNAEYNKKIVPLLNSADEVAYLNFKKIIPLLYKDKKVPTIFTILDTLSFAKNYFNDGISTINFLFVK